MAYKFDVQEGTSARFRIANNQTGDTVAHFNDIDYGMTLLRVLEENPKFAEQTKRFTLFERGVVPA